MTFPIPAMAFLAGLCLYSGSALGKEHQLSDRYTMEIDPAARQQLGDTVYNEVATFFHAAEKAIETKDLKALMELYSDNYRDGEHDKKSVEKIWERIFARFDGMTTQHTMQLANVAADKNMVVLRCSGLLLGVPEPNKGIITIDNWAMQDHVLIKEAGKWKLIGTYGTERKRLWFDKPIHPLF
jgi:ketosteroid isomerase-like protein